MPLSNPRFLRAVVIKQTITTRRIRRNALAASWLISAVLALPLAASANMFAITRTLAFGSTGDDVRALQTMLASEANIYPEGLATGYFGSLTRAAVRRFQAREGIVSNGDENSTGYGMVGPRTRAALAKMFEDGSQSSASTDASGSVVTTTSDVSESAWLIDALRNLQVTDPLVSSLDREADMNALIEKLKAYVEELRSRVLHTQERANETPSQSSGVAASPAYVTTEGTRKEDKSAEDKKQGGCYDRNGRWYPEGGVTDDCGIITDPTQYLSCLQSRHVRVAYVCRNGKWVRRM